jgi:hypothetical protein
VTEDGASIEADHHDACMVSGLTRNAVFGRFAIAATARGELLASVNTSDVNAALASLRHHRREVVLDHAWMRQSAPAWHRQCDNRSAFAISRQCLISNARHQNRVQRHF